MGKFKKICKKPLLITAICIFSIFAIALTILSNIPYAKSTYSVETSYFNISVEMKLTFKKDIVTTTMTTSIGSQVQEVKEDMQYKVKKGILYIYDEDTQAYDKLGEINVYKLELEIPLDEEDVVIFADGIEFDLYCKTTQTLKSIFITFMIISVILMLISLGFYIIPNYDIKISISIKKKPKEVVENDIKPVGEQEVNKFSDIRIYEPNESVNEINNNQIVAPEQSSTIETEINTPSSPSEE